MKPFAEKLAPLFISGDMPTSKMSPLGDQRYDSPCSISSPLTPTPTWFEVRVLYLRVSSCPCQKAPESLSMRYPPRCISTALEVNGGRVAPSEEAVVVLRRDRFDQEAREVTYVSTENLRVSGNVSFEVSHKGDLLLSGSLSHSSSCTDLLVHDDLESPGGSSQLCNYDSQSGWNMDCTCSIDTQGCVFLKAKHDFRLGTPPTMEVCVVGHYCGRPVILDQSVTLTVQRRSMRRRLSNLNVILEEDEVAKVAADEPLSPNRQLLLRVSEQSF
ncbi:hypothetical protein Mapa_000876 [Marchantia paleacea]|nr:hypothetical protein Mapa_000876 [Marchantia paleacea]